MIAADIATATRRSADHDARHRRRPRGLPLQPSDRDGHRDPDRVGRAPPGGGDGGRARSTSPTAGCPTVSMHRAVAPGHGVRRAGEELAPGQAVLPAGALVGAREVALLAAVGQSRVTVRPRPRVVVMSTGHRAHRARVRR